MTDRRIEPEDLGDFAERAEAGGLESQPRARAQLRAYREFVAPGELPRGAELAAAEEHLQRALEREIGMALGESSAPGAKQPARGAPAEPRGGGLFGWLLAPAWRPALALLMAVAAGGWLYVAVLRKPEAPVMRGPATELPEGELTIAPSPERLAGGGLRLSWSPAAEADHYDVVFLSPDLSEVARVEEIAETHLDLLPAALPGGLPPGALVLYRVVAKRGADEVARSKSAPVTMPE